MTMLLHVLAVSLFVIWIFICMLAAAINTHIMSYTSHIWPINTLVTLVGGDFVWMGGIYACPSIHAVHAEVCHHAWVIMIIDAAEKGFHHQHQARVYQSLLRCPERQWCCFCCRRHSGVSTELLAAIKWAIKDAVRTQLANIDSAGSDQRAQRVPGTLYAGHQWPPWGRHHDCVARHHCPDVLPG